MEKENTSPAPNSYWISPHRLAAGEYPGSNYLARTRQTLDSLIQANVTVFVDLTEQGEFVEYERILYDEGQRFRRLTAHYRLPIKDESVPTVLEMVEILDTIDTALSGGRAVYVHCLHGRGRTGTVIGCWMVRHGMDNQTAIEEIRQRRQSLIFGGQKSSPRTAEQQQMVLNWKAGQ